MPDPVEQTLLQGRTQESNVNLADYYFKGKQLRQQDDQINLSRQRLALEQQQVANETQAAQDRHVLAPLMERAQSLKNTSTGLDISKQLFDLTTGVSSQQGDVAVSQLIAQTLADGSFGTPEAMQRYNDTIIKTPLAALGKASQSFLQQQKIAQTVRRAQGQFGNPTSETVPNEAGGVTLYGDKSTPKEIDYLREADRLELQAKNEPSPNKSEQLLTQAEAFRKLAQGKTVGTGTLSTVGKETTDELASRGLAPGSPGYAEAYAETFKKNQDAKLAAENLQVTTNPDGTMTFTKGTNAKAAGTPAAIVTEATKRITAIQNTISQINEIQQSLRPEDVGVKGAVESLLFDKLGPAFGLNTSDAARMDARTKIDQLFVGAKRTVSLDPRFSNADNQDARGVFPGTKAMDSYELNMARMSALKHIQGKAALIEAANAKLPAPQYAMSELTKQGLIDAFDAGLLTAKDLASEKRRRDALANHP